MEFEDVGGYRIAITIPDDCNDPDLRRPGEVYAFEFTVLGGDNEADAVRSFFESHGIKIASFYAVKEARIKRVFSPVKRRKSKKP
jgi:hypothetical protein